MEESELTPLRCDCEESSSVGLDTREPFEPPLDWLLYCSISSAGVVGTAASVTRLGSIRASMPIELPTSAFSHFDRVSRCDTTRLIGRVPIRE